MPFGPYKNFADCVRKNAHRMKDAKAFCGWLKHKIEGGWWALEKLLGQDDLLKLMSNQLELMTREKARAVLDKPEKMRNVSNEVLIDDHRWVHFWATAIGDGKDVFLDKSQVRRLHQILVDEMARRRMDSGLHHKSPLKFSIMELASSMLVKILKNRKAFLVDPEWGCFVGSSISDKEAPNDIDALQRGMKNLEYARRYREALPEDLRDSVSLIWEPNGPCGPYIPGWELWAIPKKDISIKEPIFTIQPFSPFLPAKPEQSLSNDTVHELLEDSYFVTHVQGLRIMLHRKESDVMAFDADLDEFTLPDRITEAALAIEDPKTFILDGFLTKDEQKPVFNIIDMPWWRDSEHIKHTAEVRRIFMEKLELSEPLKIAPFKYFANRRDTVDFLKEERGPYLLIPGHALYPVENDSEWLLYDAPLKLAAGSDEQIKALVDSGEWESKSADARFSLMTKRRRVEPLYPFAQLKTTKKGYSAREVFGIKPVKDLAKELFRVPNKQAVEIKIDGFRGQAHKKGDEVKLFTESGHEITEQLPGVAASAKKLPAESFVMDCEATPYDADMTNLGRAGAAPAFAKGAKGPVDDSLWAFHVFDLLYIDGEDIHTLPYEERRQRLRGIELPIRDAPKNKDSFRIHFWENSVNWATSAEQMVKLAEDVSKAPGSEGAMFKQADSKYRLSGNTPLWSKMKESFEIDALVVGINQDGGRYNYVGAIGPVEGVEKADSAPIDSPKGRKFVRWKGKVYGILGKTFNTSLRAKLGQIIRVTVKNVSRIDDKVYHWFHPQVLEVREDKTKPDPLKTAETIAESAATKQKKAISWDVVDGELKVTGGQPSEAYLVRSRYGFESSLACGFAPWIAIPGAEWVYLENNEEACSILHNKGVQLLIGTDIDRDTIERLATSNIEFMAAHAETISEVRHRPMLLEEPDMPGAVSIPVKELREFYASIRSHPIPHMKLSCGSLIALKKEMHLADPYMTYPNEAQTWRFVLQFHIRGLSVHADFRAEISKTQLIGWTWSLGKSLIKPLLRRVKPETLSSVGLTREQLDNLTISEVSEKLKSSREGKKLRKLLSKKTQSLTYAQAQVLCNELWRNEVEPILKDPARKILTQRKAPEPHEWLTMKGEVDPGTPGATAELEGLFVIMDTGTVQFGAQKGYYHEYFLKGKRLNGRFFVRRLATKKKWKLKEAFAWMSFRGKPTERPYVISNRAVTQDWMPPQRMSALPKNVRTQIPDNLQYWKKKTPKAARDALVSAMRSRKVTLKLRRGLRFAVKRIWHKGPEVRRGVPIVRYWLLIHNGRQVLDAWDFGRNSDPLEGDGITARRKSGKGLEALLKKTGDIPAKHPASLTKKLQNHFDTSDEGTIQIIADKNDFLRARFKGKTLKGLHILMREDPRSEMWIWKKSELPKSKKAMLLSGLNDGRIMHLAPTGLKQEMVGDLLIVSGPAIKPGEVLPMDGRPTFFKKEGIEKIWGTMYRQPIVVLHGELKGDVIGFIDKLHYDPETGWGWIDRGVVWHPVGMKLILNKTLAAWSIEVLPQTIWDAEHNHDAVIGGQGVGVAVVPVGACKTCNIESAMMGSIEASSDEVYKFGMPFLPYVQHLYYDQMLSTQRISEQEGIPLSTLKGWMDRGMLPRRSQTEARRLRKFQQHQIRMFGGKATITVLGSGAFTDICEGERRNSPQCKEARAGGKSSRNYTSTLFSIGPEHLLINAPKNIHAMLAQKGVKPRWALLEHIHEDVVGGLHELRPLNPVVFATKEVWAFLKKHYRAFSGQKGSFEEIYNFKRYVLEPNKAVRMGAFSVKPLKVAHAKSGDPSALGFRVGVGNKTIWHCSDVYRFPENALRDVDIYIGDGASLKKDIGSGHVSMEEQIKWAKEVPEIFFTQIGHVGLTHDDLNKSLNEMAPNARALHDGAEISITSGNPGAVHSKRQVAALLEGKQSIIVRTKPYSGYATRAIYLLSPDELHGLYVEGYPDGPFPAEEVKKEMKEEHGMSTAEWKKEVGDAPQVWIYKPRILQRMPTKNYSGDQAGPYVNEVRPEREGL